MTSDEDINMHWKFMFYSVYLRWIESMLQKHTSKNITLWGKTKNLKLT